MLPSLAMTCDLLIFFWGQVVVEVSSEVAGATEEEAVVTKRGERQQLELVALCSSLF